MRDSKDSCSDEGKITTEKETRMNQSAADALGALANNHNHDKNSSGVAATDQQPGKEGQNDESPNLIIRPFILISDELITILLEVFHLCGVTSNNYDDDDCGSDQNIASSRKHRILLANAIQELQYMHQEYQKQKQQTHEESSMRLLTSFMGNNQNQLIQSPQQQQQQPRIEKEEQQQQLLLVQIEQQMKQLRFDIQHLNTTIIPQERQQILEYRQRIVQEQQAQPHQQQVYVVLKMILSEYQWQLQQEEYVIGHVLYPNVNSFYDTVDDDEDISRSNTTPTNLQFCSNVLRQRPWTQLPLLQQYFVSDIMELLLLLQQDMIGDDHKVEFKRRRRPLSTSSLKQQFLYHLEFDNHNKKNTDDETSSSLSLSIIAIPIKSQPKVPLPIHRQQPKINHATDSTITSTTSVFWEIVHSFFETVPSTTTTTIGNTTSHFNINNNKINLLLVIGSAGSGKTHLCNTVKQIASLTTTLTTVIHPKLPMDLLPQGSTFGDVEDIIISLFETIHQCSTNHRNKKVLVILDDFEHIIGTYQSNTTDSGDESPFVRRCRSTFIALLDSLQHHRLPKLHHGNTKSDCDNGCTEIDVLFVLTTSCYDVVTSMSFYFNHVCYLEPPNEGERKGLIQQLILGRNDDGDDDDDNQSNEFVLLNDIVESTIGKSYVELVQLCRQSLEFVVSTSCIDPRDDNYNVVNLDNTTLLKTMKELLQSKAPESLRGGGYIDAYVDMRVFTARDLLDMKQHNQPYAAESLYSCSSMALALSASASSAWRALNSSIILPLCQSKELHALLDTSEVGNPKTIVGAVLLTGESGSGKTTIAMLCAMYAAELLPSVKLIDVSCTSLIHKEVGASEQAIQHLFNAARRAAPAILLMDGIETIAAVRGNDATTEGTMDRILSTLLIELDGIDDNNAHWSQGGVAVIGITHDESWIDPALKRPGRLDRAITMSRDWI